MTSSNSNNIMKIITIISLVVSSSFADKLSDTWKDVSISGYIYAKNYFDSSAPYKTGYYDSLGNLDYSNARVKTRINVDIKSGTYNGLQGFVRFRAQDYHVYENNIGNSSFTPYVRYIYLKQDLSKGYTKDIPFLNDLKIMAGKQYLADPFSDDIGAGVKIDYKHDNIISRLGYYGSTGYNNHLATLDLLQFGIGYGTLKARNDKIPFYINAWIDAGFNADETNELHPNDNGTGSIDPSIDNAGGVPGDENPILALATIGFNLNHFGAKLQYAYTNFGENVLNDYGRYTNHAERAAIDISGYIDQNNTIDLGSAVNGASGKTPYDRTNMGVFDAENQMFGENYIATSLADEALYMWIRYRGKYLNNKLFLYLAYTYVLNKHNPDELIFEADSATYGSAATKYTTPKYEGMINLTYKLTEKIELSGYFSYTAYNVASNAEELINKNGLDPVANSKYISNAKSLRRGLFYNEITILYYF